MFIKILLLVLFFASMVIVGVYCKKHTKSADGFILGGRSVGPWLTAFAYGTSYFSAVIFIGYAGQFGFKFGVASTWIGIGNALIGSLLAWKFLGRRTRLITQKMDSATMPDYFGKRFDSKALKIVASLIVFVFLIPYTASLYNGLSRLFSMAFDVQYSTCIIVMASITAIYVVAGGYFATAINDFIQGIIMLVGIVAVVFAVLNVNGGLFNSLDALSGVVDPNVSSSTGVFTSLFGPDPLSLIFIVLLTSLGTWGLPQMVQKFYAIKDEKQIMKGTIISTVFALIVAGGCYFLGGFGRLFVSDVVAVGGYDAIIPTMLSMLPEILIAIVVVLVLSASMSTLSSLVLTSSSTLTMDIIKETVDKNMSEKKKVLYVRLFVVVFIAISAIIAITLSDVTFIAQLMGISWGALAGAFLAPFLWGLYIKKISKAAVWSSFIFGVGIMLVNLIFKAYLPTFLQSPINCGVIAMLSGLVIVPLVSLFTKPANADNIDDIFSCLEKNNVVE